MQTLMNARGFPFTIVTRTSRPNRSAVTDPLSGMSLTAINGCLIRSAPSDGRWVRVGFCRRRPIKPVLESGRCDACVVAGNERCVVELRPEVARAEVGDHHTLVAVRAEHTANEL